MSAQSKKQHCNIAGLALSQFPELSQASQSER